MRQLRGVANHLVVAVRVGINHPAKANLLTQLCCQLQRPGIGEDWGQDDAGVVKQILGGVLITPALPACHRVRTDILYPAAFAQRRHPVCHLLFDTADVHDQTALAQLFCIFLDVLHRGLREQGNNQHIQLP